MGVCITAWLRGPAWRIAALGCLGVLLGCAEVPAPRHQPTSSAASSAPAPTRPPMIQAGSPLPAGYGTLTLQIDPADARLRLDGRNLDLSPGEVTLAIPAGHHVVEIDHRDHGSLERSVEVSVGEDSSLVVDLAKLDELDAADPDGQTAASAADPAAAGGSTPFAGMLIGILGIAIGGTGVAAGIIFAADAADRDSERDDLIDSTSGWPDSCSDGALGASVAQDCRRIDKIEDEADLRLDLALGLIIGGGLIAALGLSALLFWPAQAAQGSRQTTRLRLAPTLGPTSAGLGLSGTL